MTGTNGKSTTCNLITHLLKKNKFKTLLRRQYWNSYLRSKNNKKCICSYRSFIISIITFKIYSTDYAFLLNITNDHLDWHGNMNNYTNSKLKIFIYQKKINLL